MDHSRIIAMWLLYRRYRKNKRNRIHWVHPINEKREESGLFYTLFEDLRKDGKKFFNYFRMSISTFDDLHQRLKYNLRRQNTKMRNCIQPEQMLAIAIRYLASGCTFTDLHYNYRIGISTASSIVRDACSSIWSTLQQECIPTPTKGRWETIAAEFEKRANFPHCLGSVDVADSNYRFVYVNIGSFGKDCDSSIFKKCSLWESIETNNQELPEERCLPGTESPNVPYFFVEDEAFALHRHLLRPYGGSNLTLKKRIFNYRLCRARRYVECTFGILSNKWRILHRPINVNPDFAVDIVKACVVLHNFVRDRDGFETEDTMTITGLEDLPSEETARGGLGANNLRNVLADYFLTDIGAVKWQMSKV
ncbi:uncharacterized protein [Anabrus simplex]|uniref:uncharacterized protein n=1 Tax=Anabrus simplex TaxID=316456 RepID=UPI0035A34732